MQRHLQFAVSELCIVPGTWTFPVATRWSKKSASNICSLFAFVAASTEKLKCICMMSCHECIQWHIIMHVICVMFVCYVAVMHKFKANAWSLEHVDNDLATLLGLREVAFCGRSLFLQRILAWLLCWILSDIPRHCTLARNIATGLCTWSYARV